MVLKISVNNAGNSTSIRPGFIFYACVGLTAASVTPYTCFVCARFKTDKPQPLQCDLWFTVHVVFDMCCLGRPDICNPSTQDMCCLGRPGMCCLGRTRQRDLFTNAGLWKILWCVLLQLFVAGPAGYQMCKTNGTSCSILLQHLCARKFQTTTLPLTRQASATTNTAQH